MWANLTCLVSNVKGKLFVLTARKTDKTENYFVNMSDFLSGTQFVFDFLATTRYKNKQNFRKLVQSRGGSVSFIVTRKVY